MCNHIRPIRQVSIDDRIESLKRVHNLLDEVDKSFEYDPTLMKGLHPAERKRLFELLQSINAFKFEALGRFTSLDKKHPAQIQNFPRKLFTNKLINPCPLKNSRKHRNCDVCDSFHAYKKSLKKSKS